MNNRHPWQLKKIKILGAALELLARQHCRLGQLGPILRKMGWIGNAGSSKTAPRILIFRIVLGAEYLFYVKSIVPYAPTFFGYIISVLASVNSPRKIVWLCLENFIV